VLRRQGSYEPSGVGHGYHGALDSPDAAPRSRYTAKELTAATWPEVTTRCALPPFGVWRSRVPRMLPMSPSDFAGCVSKRRLDFGSGDRDVAKLSRRIPRAFGGDCCASRESLGELCDGPRRKEAGNRHKVEEPPQQEETRWDGHEGHRQEASSPRQSADSRPSGGPKAKESEDNVETSGEATVNHSVSSENGGDSHHIPSKQRPDGERDCNDQEDATDARQRGHDVVVEA